MLIRLNRLSEPDQKLCETYIHWGILATIGKGEETSFSLEQFERLRHLDTHALTESAREYFIQLFPSEHELLLSETTGIVTSNERKKEFPGHEVLAQLLPRTIETAASSETLSALGKVRLPGNKLDVVSKDVAILSAVEQQIERFTKQTLQREKVSALARSAHYMGGKTLLSAALCELVEAYHPRDGVVLDLMCGSGAASGAFAHRWKVIASDAQAFSRHLAVIQGGGMSEESAKTIVQHVVDAARSHYNQLVDLIGKDIDQEERYLTSELTATDCESFISWAVGYPNISNPNFRTNPNLMTELAERKNNPRAFPATLFTRYYANLFFGVRQAAEIDSLRIAIESLRDPYHRQWALGALICAVSTCADNYGGHFAQPRFDTASPDKLNARIKDTLLRRSMSITQEFSARLLSLAHESELVPNTIDVLEGPWQSALERAKVSLGQRPTLIYLDPPYTRDEYSRYYHVLETLVLYNYPDVSGKAAIPHKGSMGRFASEFFTRNTSSIEETIVKIISTCLQNQWPCLWSYSSSGIANIDRVLDRLETKPANIEIYKAKYTYKRQGKNRTADKSGFLATPSARTESSYTYKTSVGPSIDEYMIMIQP